MWLFLRFFGCNGFGTTSRENIGFWKRTRPEQTEENNLENQNHRNNEKNEHKNKKTWETPRLCWFVSCCIYSGDSSCRVVFWRICFLSVFLFHLFFSMCCWNQLSLLKLVSQYKGQMNHIGFRVYPTISNHTLPRNVSKGGVSLSPPSFIHFWTVISLGPKLTAKCSFFGLKKIYTRIWLDFVFIQPHPTMCKF